MLNKIAVVFKQLTTGRSKRFGILRFFCIMYGC
jgi:hypothetical protein